MKDEELVDNVEVLKTLKRLALSLSHEEYEDVLEKVRNGEKTGYATLDKPWNVFYEGIEKKHIFSNTTPYQGLVLNNSGFPNDKAFRYFSFGKAINFKKIIESSDIVAKSLQEYGVKKGDFVTICSTTTPEVVYLFYAISKIGAIANVIAPFYEPEDLMARINECDSKVVIMVDKFAPKFKNHLNKAKGKEVIILPMMNSSVIRFVQKSPYHVDGKTNETPWKNFVKDGMKREEALVDPYSPKKPQAMVYSSGSTGPAKGILLSVDSFQKLIDAYGNSGFDTSRGQKVYQNIPPWHSTGLSLGINFPLSFGVEVCTDPRFDHDVFVKNVLKFCPEYILTNTSMYQGFTFENSLKKLKGRGLEFLKYPVEGGEPLTEKDIENIERVFRSHGSSARLLNGYGQCECGATVTTDITGHKFSNLASGIPLPDITTVGIFDNNFKELKYNQRGNIYVKTEIGMLEYFKKTQETEDFFFTDVNGDCWSQTGDIGYIQEDGSLVVLGRKSDYSVIDGVKVYNFDVERAILVDKKVKLCEIQTHPEDNNRLVAHIVWENDVNLVLNRQPGKLVEYLEEIQETVKNVMGISNAIPYSFCIHDKFPSAYSGKRDIAYIKNKVDDLIELEKPITKKIKNK